MAVTMFWALFLLVCCGKCLGQEISFQESDFSTDPDKNTASVKVLQSGSNPVPLTIRIHPVTISEYFSQYGGHGCNNLGDNINPAEESDFNSTVLERFLPAESDPQTYVFEVELIEDNIVEGTEVFVAILTVSGDLSTVQTDRNCTIIEMLDEPLNDQFLKWTQNGLVTDSFSQVFIEENGTHTIITAERLLPAEVNVTFQVSLQQGSGLTEGMDFTFPEKTYIMTPEQTRVDILLHVIDDDIVEYDEEGIIVVTASVPSIFLGGDGRRTIALQILDDDILEFGLLNPPVIMTIEGESVNIIPGFIGNIPVNQRSSEFGSLYTKNGSALEGIDFIGFVETVLVGASFNQSRNVMTIARSGIQPTRSFSVLLRPHSGFPIHNKTIISGTVVINILDNSNIPLAPIINSLDFVNTTEGLLNVTWYQESSAMRPVEDILILIKSCDTESCEINPKSLQSDEELIKVNSSNEEFGEEYEYFWEVDGKTAVYAVVICAANLLGRNCTSSEKIIVPHERLVIEMPLVPSIRSLHLVNASENTKRMLNISWHHMTTITHPADIVYIIIKTCASEPCEINPDSLQDDEERIVLQSNQGLIYRYLLSVDDKAVVHAVVVCASNSLGRSCSSSEVITLPKISVGNEEIFHPTTTTNSSLNQGEAVTSEVKGVVIFLVVFLLLCCLLLLLLLIIFCWYINRERSYYPSNKMGKEIKGYSPSGSDTADIYVNKENSSEMKYI